MAEGWAICTLSGQLVDSDAGYRSIVGIDGDATAAGFDFVSAGVITTRQLVELGDRLRDGGFTDDAYPYQRLDGTIELARVAIEPLDLSGTPAYAVQVRPIEIRPRSSLRDSIRRECFRALRAVLPTSRD